MHSYTNIVFKNFLLDSRIPGTWNTVGYSTMHKLMGNNNDKNAYISSQAEATSELYERRNKLGPGGV